MEAKVVEYRDCLTIFSETAVLHDKRPGRGFLGKQAWIQSRLAKFKPAIP